MTIFVEKRLILHEIRKIGITFPAPVTVGSLRIHPNAIGVGETYIDFLGDKADIRLTYGGNFTIWVPIIMIPPTIGRGIFYVVCIN